MWREIHIFKENDQIVGNKKKLDTKPYIKAQSEEMWILCSKERNAHFEENRPNHGQSKKCGFMSI